MTTRNDYIQQLRDAYVAARERFGRAIVDKAGESERRKRERAFVKARRIYLDEQYPREAG